MTALAETGWYNSRLGAEQYLRFLPQSRLQVFFIEPLFEERNFLRHTIAEVARALAEQGVGSFIPDLPGSGESRIALDHTSLSDWREALTDASQWLNDAAGGPPHIAAFRGGALLDDAAIGASWWRFAPATGIEILRPMRRAGLLTGKDAMLAGYAIPPRMIADIEQASPQAVAGPLHECRAQSEGAPLWRRAEPGEDRDLVTTLADDLAQWVRSCARR